MTKCRNDQYYNKSTKRCRLKKNKKSKSSRRKSSRKSSKKRKTSRRKSPKNNSRKPYRVVFSKSTRDGKKMTATFYNSNGDKIKTTHFGAKNYADFTTHRDPARKQRYLNRHKARENWNDPMSAGALSKWILWNKPSLSTSKSDYKRRFNLK